MIQLGKVKGNKMVNMQLSNLKLQHRGVQMILDEFPSISYLEAQNLLSKFGSVSNVLKTIS